MNNIQVIGNLTGDPIQTEIGEYKVTKFTVAADRRQIKGEKKTDFFKVSAWGGLGDTCFKYLQKGRKAYVRGELQVREYENAEGKTATALDIRAEAVEFLGGRSEEAAPDQPKPKAKKNYTEADFTDIQSDDIPF